MCSPTSACAAACASSPASKPAAPRPPSEGEKSVDGKRAPTWSSNTNVDGSAAVASTQGAAGGGAPLAFQEKSAMARATRARTKGADGLITIPERGGTSGYVSQMGSLEALSAAAASSSARLRFESVGLWRSHQVGLL